MSFSTLHEATLKLESLEKSLLIAKTIWHKILNLQMYYQRKFLFIRTLDQNLIKFTFTVGNSRFQNLQESIVLFTNTTVELFCFSWSRSSIFFFGNIPEHRDTRSPIDGSSVVCYLLLVSFKGKCSYLGKNPDSFRELSIEFNSTLS